LSELLLWRRRELFNKTNNKVWFTVTGCSPEFASLLMSYGGASKTVLGIYCPYNPAFLTDLLEYSPQKCVSEQVASDMCKKTYSKFRLFSTDIVVSCTASLCKIEGEREDRVNEAFICISRNNETMVIHKDYTSYKKTDLDGPRRVQEVYLGIDIITALFDFVGIE
jgi:nicotinamide mononucleotide (NMN) deamidase PncC